MSVWSRLLPGGLLDCGAAFRVSAQDEGLRFLAIWLLSKYGENQVR